MARIRGHATYPDGIGYFWACRPGFLFQAASSTPYSYRVGVALAKVWWLNIFVAYFFNMLQSSLTRWVTLLLYSLQPVTFPHQLPMLGEPKREEACIGVISG